MTLNTTLYQTLKKTCEGKPLYQVFYGLPILMLMACSGNEAETSSTVPIVPISESTPKVQIAQNSAPDQTEAQLVSQLGAKVYKKCRTCHTLNEGGRHKVGPNLWNIYGMKAGQQDGFAYSKVMMNSGIIWNDETMDGYLANPSKYMPGNRMSFIGLRKKEDRDNLQIYLKERTTPKGE